MELRVLLRAANPYLGVVAVLVLLAALLGAIYFTWFELQWTAFLAGMPMAAVLAMVGRASRAERSSEHRGAQLVVLRHKLTQETERRSEAEQALASAREALKRFEPPAAATPDARGSREQKVYAESLTRDLTGWKNLSERLIAALEQNEFCLYAQSIVPLGVEPAAAFHEILIRLQEEERNLMPPGAFLPLAEEQGLLPALDRWVVNRLLDWVQVDPARSQAQYSVNISAATLADAEFAAFVIRALGSRGLREGLLCVEIDEADAAAREADAQNLVRKLKEAGCRSALSQFGRSRVSFSLLKPLCVDYLKIDGNIVLAMLRDPIALAKVKAITRVARDLGMKTVAELVENTETLSALRDIGADFAQGFAIAHPRPLEELGPR